MERLKALDPEAHRQELKKTAGVPMQPFGAKSWMGLALIAVFAGAVVWGGVKLVSAFNAPNSPETEAKLTEIKLQRIARERVSARLKDPDSAQFQNQSSQCGEVNAKNSFGAYGGYTRFIATSKEMVLMDDGSSVSKEEFENLWSSACK